MKELVNEQIQGERCGDDNVWLIRKKENHYTTPKGKKVKLSPEEQQMVNKMRIPPMWNPVEICSQRKKVLWVALKEIDFSRLRGDKRQELLQDN